MEENRETIPSYMPIPRDDDDYRFTQSFEVDEAGSEAPNEFYNDFGFVIFRNVISSGDCAETIDDFWSLLEEQQSTLHRDDPSTWNQGLTHFGMPKVNGAIFRKSLLSLRQDINIHRCFASIIGTDDLIVSHDRWLLHRPTRDVGGIGIDRPEWESKRNIHLDLNPWEYTSNNCLGDIQRRLGELDYANSRSFVSEMNDVHESMGPYAQGILNLMDVTSTDNGGTILVPGSHRTFQNWIRSDSVDTKQRVSGPMQYKVHNDDELQSFAQHVTLRAGSLLIFDRRCFHGSTPNKSSQCRAAVPIFFTKSSILMSDKKRAKGRAASIERQINNVGFRGDLTQHGKEVFGLNL
jgi:hypothetical protein